VVTNISWELAASIFKVQEVHEESPWTMKMEAGTSSKTSMTTTYTDQHGAISQKA
jgi:hypothetical protein